MRSEGSLASMRLAALRARGECGRSGRSLPAAAERSVRSEWRARSVGDSAVGSGPGPVSDWRRFVDFGRDDGDAVGVGSGPASEARRFVSGVTFAHGSTPRSASSVVAVSTARAASLCAASSSAAFSADVAAAAAAAAAAFPFGVIGGSQERRRVFAFGGAAACTDGTVAAALLLRRRRFVSERRFDRRAGCSCGWLSSGVEETGAAAVAATVVAGSSSAGVGAASAEEGAVVGAGVGGFVAFNPGREIGAREGPEVDGRDGGREIDARRGGLGAPFPVEIAGGLRAARRASISYPNQDF